MALDVLYATISTQGNAVAVWVVLCDLTGIQRVHGMSRNAHAEESWEQYVRIEISRLVAITVDTMEEYPEWSNSFR